MEGPRFISDYLKSGRPEWIILSEDSTVPVETVAREGSDRGIPLLEVPAGLFGEISDTRNSQGIIAVCPLPEVTINSLPRRGVFLLLDGVSDPGNMGTIIRSAAAFGAAAVIAGKGSSCPFSPKVTRSAAGLNAVVPILFDVDLAELMRSNSDSMVFFGADTSGGSLEELRREKGCLGLVIGSEAHGISEDTAKHLKATVSIPMADGVESLNAAVSASIILYAMSNGDR